MIIKKLINNNVLIATDDKKGEVVLMGVGLAFQTKVGKLVDESKIQRTFVLKTETKLNELLEEIPIAYLGITEEIVNYARNNFEMEISDSIYLSLTDHIYYAVLRLKEGNELSNPFLLDIKHMFKEEWEVGLYGKKTLEELMNIEIPESEVAYIALHIIESRYNLTARNTSEIVNISNEIFEIISHNYSIPTDCNSLAYNRLVQHVKYFVQRYLINKENQNKDCLIDDVYTERFVEECKCIEKVSEYLKNRYGRGIQPSEISYLILHLRNCRNFK